MASMNRSLTWWLVGIVATVALIYGLAKLGSGTSTTDISATLAVTAVDHVQGLATAPVTLIEYSDFQCPACSYYYPIIKAAQAAAGDKLRLIYREFPLRSVHQNAQIGAQAAEAASLQGKFWEMHDLLFERQSTWSAESDPTATLTSYAKELKLDVTKFAADLNSQTVLDRVQLDYDSGTKINLQGTPTLYLNGKPFNTPFTQTDLVNAINAAAKK